jgi:hypothetical protein
MKRFVILNGPAGSGKDTIAKAYKEKYEIKEMPVHIMAFKDALYKAAFKIFSSVLDWHAFKMLCTHRVLKEEPTDVFFGMSPRQMLIHVSENIIKPLYGNDYFGRKVVEAAEGLEGIILLTDGGFHEEINPLPETTTTIVQVHREGCDFVGDSRTYIDIWKFNIQELHNDGTIDDTVEKLNRIIGPKVFGFFDPGSLGDVIISEL